MYTARHFHEEDWNEIRRLVVHHGLAVLISNSEDGFDATHAPILFDPDDEDCSMIGHMARANRHWRRIAEDQPVLAVFRAPDAYVSPSFYVAEEDVPTWNYAAVHVHGTWKRITEADKIRHVLAHTVHAFERNIGSNWEMESIDPDLVDSLVERVYAFRINIQYIEAAQKMSQDKVEADVKAVIDGLCAHAGAPADVAKRMQRVTLARGHYRK